MSLADPALCYLYENWKSGEALDAHFETPHLRDCMNRTAELLEGGADACISSGCDASPEGQRADDKASRLFCTGVATDKGFLTIRGH